MSKFRGKLIMLAAYKRSKQAMPYPLKKILIVTYDAIGDMIITTPVFRILKENYPDIQIDVLASTRNFEIIQFNPFVRRVYIQNRSKWNLRELKTIWIIKREKYDIIINLWHKISLSLTIKLRLMHSKFYLSPPKRKDFLKTYNLKTQQLRIYDLISGTEHEKHYTEVFLDTLQVFSIKKSEKIRYDFFYGEQQREKAQHFFGTLEPAYKIGLNFYVNAEQRRIDKEDVITITCQLLDLLPNSIVILIFPIQAQSLAREIKDGVNSSRLHLCPTGTILEIGAFIDQMDLIITPDTSIVHIACALNKKLVAIYSNEQSNYIKFKPICDNFRVVLSEHSHINSIKGFSTEQVIHDTIELYHLTEAYKTERRR